MSNFYEKKRNELIEEVEFLVRRKNEIEKLSDKKRIEIFDKLNELEELKQEEIAVIKRLRFLEKSELNIYKVFLPYHAFISSTKNDVKDIQVRIKNMGDYNE